MRRQLVAEVRKLRTTRTVWGLLAGLVTLTSLGVVSVMLDARPGQLAAAIGDAPFLSIPIGIAWLFVLVLGLRSFTDEFRHGSIVPTLLAVTLLYQGGLALYFLRRRPLLERYLAGTPAWARAALEAMDP